MEFIRGQKLTSLPKHEIRALVDVGQTAFLVQLLDVGYLHAGELRPAQHLVSCAAAIQILTLHACTVSACL